MQELLISIYLIVLAFNWEPDPIIKLKQLLKVK